MRKLFGADGIRGEIDVSPLDTESVSRIATALGLYIREKKMEPVCLLGCDTRESSQRVKRIFIDRLNRLGVGTVDANVVPTSAISFLIARKGIFSSGLVFSASHNPINENGIKIFNEHGIKITSEDEELIENFFADSENFSIKSQYALNVNEYDYAKQYIRELVKEFKDFNWKNLKIMLDCANGSSYIVAPRILETLGCNFSLINAWPDGTNINQDAGSEYARHHPDKIMAMLLRDNSKVSISLDGDADRVVFIDDLRNYYDGDSLLAILGLRYKELEYLKKDRVVTTTMSNKALGEYFAKKNIILDLVANGDKYITSAIVENDLTLGGEQIGHIVIHNQPGWLTGDGLRTALTTLSELTKNPGMTISDMLQNLKKYPQVLVSVNLDTKTNLVKEDIPGLCDLISKIEFSNPDVRVSQCRPASTENCYRLLLESNVTPTAILMSIGKRLGSWIYRHIPTKIQTIYALDCVSGGIRML